MNCGMKSLLKDLMQFPVQDKRKQRVEKFEFFINTKLSLSKECSDLDEIEKIWNDYPIIISGSDQIWNKHSLEMEHNDIKFMYPYLLKGYSGKKVSYASSIANMSDQELEMILFDIKKFDYIAMRELESAKKMTNILDRKIEAVVDPTFLLRKEEWIDNMNIQESKDKDKYILYYSLGGIQPLKENTTVLRKIAQSKGLKIKIVTPFAYIKMDDEIIEMHPEIGPEEFLELIYNARMVVTNSYHGTILAVNLNKDVYSLCENFGSEFRKTDILKRKITYREYPAQTLMEGNWTAFESVKPHSCRDDFFALYSKKGGVEAINYFFKPSIKNWLGYYKMRFLGKER